MPESPPGRRRRARGLRRARRADAAVAAAQVRARLIRVLESGRRAKLPVPLEPPAERPVPEAHRSAPEPTADDEEPPVDATAEPTVGPAAHAPLTRQAVLGLALVCLVGVAAAGVHLLRARPSAVDVPVAPTRSLPASARPSAAVVVDVAGAVRRPGVYSLATGSRVADALRRAGGAVRGADTTTLNLARLLVDGEQVLVTRAGAAAPPPGGGGGSAAGPGAVVDLNSATIDQLEALPGVGPVLAQRILDWRRDHGRFSSVDELQEVSGVGERKFAELKDKVRV